MASSPTASPAASPVASPSTNSTQSAPAPSASSPPPPPPSEVPAPSPPAPPPPLVASTPPPPSPVPPTTSNSPPPTSPPPPTSSGTGSPSPPPPPLIKASPPPTSTKASPPPPSTKASPPPPPSTKSTTSTSPSPSSISGTSLIGVGVAGVIAASVILILLICLCKKKKRKRYYPGEYFGPPGGPPAHYKESYFGPDERQQWGRSPAGSDSMVQMSPTPPGSLPPPIPSPKKGYSPIPPAPAVGSASMGNSKSWFTYEELATATGGFAKSNILGQGGFGFVYKGVLPGGQVVAVKQLKVGGQQGEKEFRAEVEIISRVHHRHLVSLVGYCIADSQRLLVYDYVPNGTVDYHLHRKRGWPVMDWPTRVKIASGAARGLAYLHEDCHPRIIHRDIKSSNILLDNNFEAQVSDFGLAKLTSDTNTHVTTRVMGTFGYLAPEYASSGKLTEKSDVFSFGVVLLELVTGRKPVDQTQPIGEESLVEWARPVLTQITSEEDLDLLVDPSLNGVYDKKEMLRIIEAAAACIRLSVTRRPRMGQVVRALEGDASLADLNKGIKPGHSSLYNSSFTSSDYDNSNYSTEIRRFRQVALESQEYGSEYSGATSDYGVNPSASSSEYQTSAEVDRKIGKSQPSKPRSVRKNLSTSSSNELPSS